MSDEAPQSGGESPEQPTVPPVSAEAAAAPADPAPADPAPADPAPADVAAVDAIAPEPSVAPVAADAAPAEDPFGGMSQANIDELLRQASFDDPTAGEPAGMPSASATAVAELPETSPMSLPNFNQVMRDAQVSSIDLLRDVDLNVKIELGRSRMLVEDVLKLSEGSVVELDKLAGDPVDVFVNDRLVARGEVLVLNDNFCVRINEIVAGIKEEGL
ncbi:MAG: Flagellar motor switch protein FliN [Phycisphaerales bacterium]|nr:Flagellar motor switch protein FliN [Phycisphaerales bacterium]